MHSYFLLCLVGNFVCFLSSAKFFQNQFSGIHQSVNSLYPSQAQQNVGPDLGSKCLQRVSTHKSCNKPGNSSSASHALKFIVIHTYSHRDSNKMPLYFKVATL